MTSTPHDSSYKLLFSFKLMVKDLLQGFVAEDWVEHLDFEEMNLVGAEHVSGELVRRSNDLIWKVRTRSDTPHPWCYVYLMLEFQSTQDPFMAVRMMTYVGLLYQGLIRSNVIKPGEPLPPVFPLVLYNGNAPWTSALDLSDLHMPVPSPLDAFQPRMQYCLLDQGRRNTDDPALSENLVATLIGMETAKTPEQFHHSLEHLITQIPDVDTHALGQAFFVWVTEVLSKRHDLSDYLKQLTTLQEVSTMLAENMDKWFEEHEQAGLQKGLEQGLEQGLVLGLQKGRLEGRLETLHQLLEFRFGKLEADHLQRLNSATPEQLDSWTRAIIAAPSLDDVFRDH